MSVNAVQQISTMVFDQVSNLLTQTNGLGIQTSYAYDNLNRRVNEFNGFGLDLVPLAACAPKPAPRMRRAAVEWPE
jgi:YD repeat-containing protein